MLTVLVGVLAVVACSAMAAPLEDAAGKAAALISPAKLATLGKRGANPRIQKVVAILEDGRRDGLMVSVVASNAVYLAGYTNALLAELTRDALTRNHDIATKLGVFTEAGLNEMRRGKAPTVQTGPYQGDTLSVDHIIPRAACPQLDNVIANLELMPMKLNAAKQAKMGDRQRELLKRFRSAGFVNQ